MSFFFLSYSHKDKTEALDLIGRLQNRGFKNWFDGDLKPGQDYHSEIAARINASAAVIVLFSENSITSVPVISEAKSAFDQRKLILVRSASFAPVAPPFPFERLQWVPSRSTSLIVQSLNDHGVASEKPSNTSLFNGADAAISKYLSVTDFEQSLLMNILFQERVVLHEAYFFNAALLGLHIRSSNTRSLFEVGAENGIIVPAFRNRHSKSLEDALESCQREYGPAFVVDDNIRGSLDRLIASVDRGREKTSAIYWPSESNSGEGYADVVSKLMRSEEPPLRLQGKRAETLPRLWRLTQKWRTDCVDEALAETSAKGGKGLSRAELYKAVARTLGINEIKHDHSFEVELFKACPDADTAAAAKAFLKWLAQCHHINFASQISVSVNFPAYDFNEDFVLESILRTPLDDEPRPEEGMRCEMLLPTMQQLLGWGPRNILAVRNEFGHGYLHALRRWQLNPTDESNRYRLTVALEDYCGAIARAFSMSETQPGHVDFGPLPVSQSQMRDGKLGASGSVMSLPELISADAITQVGYCLPTQSVQALTKSTIEVSVPAQL